MSARHLRWLFLLSLFVGNVAAAQNFSGDARKIAMGGIGYSDNITEKMIGHARPYTPIVLPIGLIQLAQDWDHFDPDKDSFDPILALEYAANPLHFVFGRNPDGSRGRFVEDIVDATFNRDLNTYRGFVPTDKLVAEGLASPNWGKTFKLQKKNNGSFQGFYVGAGPYLSVKTDLNFDQGLIDVLGSAAPVQIPNREFVITDSSSGQLALAITGGYRARIALPGSSASGPAEREGIYLGANYHYLRGFRNESADLQVHFDTDSAGLLTLAPTTTPVVVDYLNARSGSGFAIDLGIGAVIDNWEFGFGANGIANRIEWTKISPKRYTLQSLLNGGDFIEEVLPAPTSKLRVELPVDYTGNLGYTRGAWSFGTEFSQGFQGFSFHGGVERRFGWIELRGGGRYSLERWHPSGGVGFNFTDRFSVDVAAYGTTTNLERQLRAALAISLRLNHLTF